MRNRWFGWFLLVLLAIAILGAGASAALAAPGNDNISAAQDLASATSGSVSGSNSGATMQKLPAEVYFDIGEKYSIWYKWTAPADDVVSFDSSGAVPAVAAVNQVRVYGPHSTTPAANALSPVPDVWYVGDYLGRGHAVFPVSAGQTYYIAVVTPVGDQVITGNTILNWHTMGYNGHITGKVTATGSGSNIAVTDVTVTGMADLA